MIATLLYGLRGGVVVFGYPLATCKTNNLLQIIHLQEVEKISWYRKRGSNPHGRNAQGILSPSCLPFHHSGTVSFWLRGQDSNMRPPGYEPGELPTAPPRDVMLCNIKRASLFLFAGAKLVLFSDITKRNGDFLRKKLRVCGFFLYFASTIPPKSAI